MYQIACRDVRNDCANYDKEACNGVFKAWAITNCAETCGYCTSKYPIRLGHG